MFILKYIDIILVIVVCGYIGFYKSKVFGYRVLELKKLKNALSIFKSKIEFTYEPIRDIFGEISRVVYNDDDNFFKNFCDKKIFNDITMVWNQAVNETKDNLNKEDKEVILMLGKMLGKTDKNGQISEIEMVSNFLDKQIVDSEEQRNKNEKLYKTLGVICGLTIAIIFV